MHYCGSPIHDLIVNSLELGQVFINVAPAALQQLSLLRRPKAKQKEQCKCQK